MTWRGLERIGTFDNTTWPGEGLEAGTQGRDAGTQGRRDAGGDTLMQCLDGRVHGCEVLVTSLLLFFFPERQRQRTGFEPKSRCTLYIIYIE